MSYLRSEEGYNIEQQTSIVYLDNAKYQIEQAKTVQDVKIIRDKAKVLEDLAKRQNLSLTIQNDIAVIFCIPKTSDISYYDTTKSVNTKEHHYFLWIPNHPKWKKYQYDDVLYLSHIYFPLKELREILDFELLEKDQSILTDFGGSN